MSITHVRLHLNHDGWLMAIDLKDAYWHVLVYKRLRKYLAFRFDNRTFQFTELSFGFFLAPRVFTKTAKIIAAKLSTLSIRILMCLNNWPMPAPFAHQVELDNQNTLEVAEKIEFLIHSLGKSSFVPTKQFLAGVKLQL